MRTALDQFHSNLDRARAMIELARALARLTAGSVDCSDILRASIVLATSALDHYVHEVVRLGVIETHSRAREATAAYLAFRVPLRAVRDSATDATSCAWLEQAVREAHGSSSFQRPDRIADAVRLISDVRLWEEVGRTLGLTEEVVRTRLKAIVDRRNKIAHEADIDALAPPRRWPIDERMTLDALAFIDSVGGAVLAAIRSPTCA